MSGFIELSMCCLVSVTLNPESVSFDPPFTNAASENLKGPQPKSAVSNFLDPLEVGENSLNRSK